MLTMLTKSHTRDMVTRDTNLLRTRFFLAPQSKFFTSYKRRSRLMQRGLHHSTNWNELQFSLPWLDSVSQLDGVPSTVATTKCAKLWRYASIITVISILTSLTDRVPWSWLSIATSAVPADFYGSRIGEHLKGIVSHRKACRVECFSSRHWEGSWHNL